jgi:cyanate lyase
MKYNVKEMRDLKKDGFTNAEIANQLGCSEELVKKKLARKKSAVKSAVKKVKKVEDPSDAVEPLDSPSVSQAEPEVGPDESEVKRNWMGFKKKDQS